MVSYPPQATDNTLIIKCIILDVSTDCQLSIIVHKIIILFQKNLTKRLVNKFKNKRRRDSSPEAVASKLPKFASKARLPVEPEGPIDFIAAEKMVQQLREGDGDQMKLMDDTFLARRAELVKRKVPLNTVLQRYPPLKTKAGVRTQNGLTFGFVFQSIICVPNQRSSV